MNTQLKIKNFKRIKDEILLKDFSRVNYLVGENGCGKTSILNAISYLNETSNARVFFRKDSTVNFSLGDKERYLIWDDNAPNKTKNNGGWSPRICSISLSGAEKGSNGISKYETGRNINITAQSTLDGLNKTLVNLSHPTLKAEKLITDDVFSHDNGRPVIKEGEVEINPNFLADGVKFFYNFCIHLEAVEKMVKSAHPQDVFFIIIEEPETNLHPKWQKQIPVLLNNFITNVNESLQSGIYFFVSTHSPFVIGSASNYEEQKVYLIDNGALLNKDQIECKYSNGYTGTECASIVGQMLGADVTDLGYPINYCILEEYSMQCILENLKEKGIIKNITFVSAAGVDRVDGFKKTLDEINKLSVLVNCNPFYKNKYYIIVDNIGSLSEKPKARLNKIREKLSDRFTELQKESLEDYYQNIDAALCREVKQAIIDNPKEKGIIKAEYAYKIVEKINSVEDFSKLFGNELNFLLK